MPKIQWGILIVNYLFLGGLSAGIFFVAALATYLQQKDETAYARIARYGAMMAPWRATGHRVGSPSTCSTASWPERPDWG